MSTSDYAAQFQRQVDAYASNKRIEQIQARKSIQRTWQNAASPQTAQRNFDSASQSIQQWKQGMQGQAAQAIRERQNYARPINARPYWEAPDYTGPRPSPAAPSRPALEALPYSQSPAANPNRGVAPRPLSTTPRPGGAHTLPNPSFNKPPGTALPSSPSLPTVRAAAKGTTVPRPGMNIPKAPGGFAAGAASVGVGAALTGVGVAMNGGSWQESVGAGIGVGVGGLAGGVVGAVLGAPLGPVGAAVGLQLGAAAGAWLGGQAGFAIGDALDGEDTPQGYFNSEYEVPAQTNWEFEWPADTPANGTTFITMKYLVWTRNATNQEPWLEEGGEFSLRLRGLATSMSFTPSSKPIKDVVYNTANGATAASLTWYLKDKAPYTSQEGFAKAEPILVSMNFVPNIGGNIGVDQINPPQGSFIINPGTVPVGGANPALAPAPATGTAPGFRPVPSPPAPVPGTAGDRPQGATRPEAPEVNSDPSTPPQATRRNTPAPVPGIKGNTRGISAYSPAYSVDPETGEVTIRRTLPQERQYTDPAATDELKSFQEQYVPFSERVRSFEDEIDRVRQGLPTPIPLPLGMPVGAPRAGDYPKPKGMPQGLTTTRPTTTTNTGLKQAPPPPQQPPAPTATNCGCNIPLLQGQQQIQSQIAGLAAEGGSLAAIMSKLNEMQAFAAKAWEMTRLQKVLDVLTFIGVMHTVFMLSRDVGETFLYAISNALSAVGVKDEEGGALDLQQILGKSVNSLLVQLFGQEVVDDARETFKKANRVIQTGSAIIWTVRSLADTTLDLMEWVAENTGKIGNALKRFGVVGDRAYPWMSESAQARNRMRARFGKGTETLENAADRISVFDMATMNVIELQEEIGELGQNFSNFKASVTDAVPDPWADNTPVQDSVNAEFAASQSLDITAVDADKGG